MFQSDMNRFSSNTAVVAATSLSSITRLNQQTSHFPFMKAPPFYTFLPSTPFCLDLMPSPIRVSPGRCCSGHRMR